MNEPIVAEIPQVENEVVAPIVPEIPKPVLTNLNPTGTKVSALSLASIKAKKDLEAQQNQHQKHKEELPSEAFNETDMLLQWNKFAQKMTDSGKRLLATYMQMNDPTVNGSTITLELPNQSTKEEFLSALNETRYQYPQTRHSNGHWLKNVLKNYEEHTGIKLQVR